MKSILLPALLAGFLVSEAQTTVISVGGSPTLLIKSGTIFSADSLVLTPGADFTLSSNNIKVSPVAVNLAPRPSIDRVYYLGSQIVYTGTIQVYYQPSELNGNPEASLQYTDSALSSTWFASSTSTVNTTSHFVQQTASARPFIGVTASSQATTLALTLISFSGAWKGDQAGLEWVINQSDEMAGFVVESSINGTDWKKIGEVAGLPGNGLYTYDFTDTNPSSINMFYRIEVLRASGQVDYSPIVKLTKEEDNTFKLVASGNTVTVLFTGAQPASVRLINPLGQIIRIDRTSRPEYAFYGLFPGVYFMQYERNGQTGAKGFLIQ
jgi:hypothetical protein